MNFLPLTKIKGNSLMEEIRPLTLKNANAKKEKEEKVTGGEEEIVHVHVCVDGGILDERANE